MSDRPPLLLVGGGGHAAVVADAARSAGWTLVGFLDDDEQVVGPPGLTRLGAIAGLGAPGHDHALAVHAAIGDPELRKTWSERMGDRIMPPIVHASAVVSPSAVLARGSFVGPKAVINARARVGEGVIVNSGAIVEHDGRLEPYCHVAPAAVLAGRVTVGRNAFIGAGAVVVDGCEIGAGATIGAGAVAIRSVPPGVTAVGVPSRPAGGDG